MFPLQVTGVLLDPISILILILGALIGVFMGMLPGLGGTITLALLIPLTFGMDPLVAFMLLIAANGGTSQGGSVTAILLNTPGKAPNAATLLDGYPLARQGRAGEAIGASAAASALGAILGVGVLVLSIPVMLQLILLFGAPEIFWLGIWGLSVIAIIVSGNVLTGLISAGFGLLFAMHGVSRVTAGTRWVFDIPEMLDGIPLIPALIGLFAVSEMIKLSGEGGTITEISEDTAIGDGTLAGMKQVLVHKWLLVRSALIGTFIGTIPGVGGVAANYIAYFQAMQSSSDPEEFGSGDIRGVIASEASNDAKEGGSLIPTLGFGIPGSASMAVLFGAFLLHGITPGPLLIDNHMDVVTVIIISALASNIISSAIIIGLADHLVKITRIDVKVIAPVVISVALMASFAISSTFFPVWITLAFGILGFVMIKVDMARVPMILGMVLGPIVERNFFRSLQISGGSLDIFFASPVSIALIVLIGLSFLLPLIREHTGTEEVISQ